jgi:hypothetical protein
MRAGASANVLPVNICSICLPKNEQARRALEDGGNTNFAGTFPIWDILFGTFRMPENRLPDNYGKDEPAIPSEIAGQLAYPFRQ